MNGKKENIAHEHNEKAFDDVCDVKVNCVHVFIKILIQSTLIGKNGLVINSIVLDCLISNTLVN